MPTWNQRAKTSAVLCLFAPMVMFTAHNKLKTPQLSLLHKVATMFAMRPNPKAAMKEVKSNLLLFGSLMLAVRLSTYMMHLAQKGSRK